MKRILNFVVILLTTLSIVNAVNIPLRKRAIAFAACPSGSPQFSAASIDPDPPVAGKAATAKFSFTLPANFDSGKFAADATSDGGKAIDGFPQGQDICTLDGITCPIASGSTVEIQTPIKIPDDAPDTYTLEYSLVDGTGKEIACSSGPVIGAAKAPGGKGPDDGGDGGKGPGPDGGDGGKGPGPDGGDGGKGPGPDGGHGGKGPGPDGGDGGKCPGADGGDGKGPGPDGGDGGKGPGPDGGDGGPPKGPDGPPDGGPAKGKGGPPDGGDGGDGGP